MPVGISDGSFFQDDSEHLASVHEPLTSKERSDAIEMQRNEFSTDFQSRFQATNDSTMPLGASTELAGALKSSGSTKIPGNAQNPKSEGPMDAWNALTGQGDYEGKRIQLWPERVVRAAWEGLKAPGEAAQGKLPMWAADEEGNVRTSPQAIEKANELAGLMVMGPAPVAAKLADGTLGSFAGVKAIQRQEGQIGKTEVLKKGSLKNRFYEAQEMEFAGAHPDDIWVKTGFARGADSRWRYEISDREMSLNMKNLNYNRTVEHNPDGWSSTANHGQVIETVGAPKIPEYKSGMNFDDWVEGKGAFAPKTLKDVMDHDELFKAYPELKDVKIAALPDKLQAKALALFSEKDNTVYMSEMSPEMFRNILMHEIQHWIQKHEGFSRGGNSSMFTPPALKEARTGFLEAKNEFIKNNPDAMKKYKGVVEAEINGRLNTYSEPLQEAIRNKLKEAKEAGVYESVRNIVKSEKLLREQNLKQEEQYRRLMGEVESRNVENRINYDVWERRTTRPERSEDVPRPLQIESYR